MALPDSLKIISGTDIVVADTTDHAPATANNLGTRTDQIDCTSLADTAARQSAKLDFGANRALTWIISAVIEFAATPTAGEVVEFYLAKSNSATASTANGGGVSGSDSAYTGTTASTLVESVKQLTRIGTFVCTDDATGTVQIQFNCGRFQTEMRYGTLIVKNESGAAFHSDMVETSFVFSPVETQIQD